MSTWRIRLVRVSATVDAWQRARIRRASSSPNGKHVKRSLRDPSLPPPSAPAAPRLHLHLREGEVEGLDCSSKEGKGDSQKGTDFKGRAKRATHAEASESHALRDFASNPPRLSIGLASAGQAAIPRNAGRPDRGRGELAETECTRINPQRRQVIRTTAAHSNKSAAGDTDRKSVV